MVGCAIIITYLPNIMDDGLSIDVVVGGKEYTFETRLAAVGYTHRFYVLINGIEVVYEPDEERNYRAVLNNADHAKVNDHDMELIKAVGEQIEAIGK